MPSLGSRQQVHNRALPAPRWTETSVANGSRKAGSDREGDSFNDNSNSSGVLTPTTRCGSASSTSSLGHGYDNNHHRGHTRAHKYNHSHLGRPALSSSRCGCRILRKTSGGSHSRRRCSRSNVVGVLACVAAASLLGAPLLQGFVRGRFLLPAEEHGARSRDFFWNVLNGTAQRLQVEHQSGDSERGTGSRSGGSGHAERVEAITYPLRGGAASGRGGDGVDAGQKAGTEGLSEPPEGTSGGDAGGGNAGGERADLGGELVGLERQRTGDRAAAAEAAAAREAVAEAVAAEEQSQKPCSEYLNKYGIIPNEAWGFAPESIQDAWTKIDCDRVIDMNGFSLDDPPPRGKRRAIILVWSNIQGWLSFLEPKLVRDARETCASECIFTGDRRLLPKADGVFFHASTHKQPDGRGRLPMFKPPGVDYIFVNLEPPTYGPVQALLGDEKFMSNFDRTMTYERSSDVPLTYVGDRPASIYFAAPKASFKAKDGYGEPDAIAAFVSNCEESGAHARLKYIAELMENANVHSFGKCLHNREEPELWRGTAESRVENKIAVLGRYKFLLAFENTDRHRDYVTEKVYHGLQAGTLPVYWGAENVDDFVPKHSVVKASDFSSPAELGQYLNMLAADEEAYEEYFEWKDDLEEQRRIDQDVTSLSAYGVNAMCRLCDRVLLDKAKDEKTTR